ncbi:MAG: hypothetical protein ABWZ52_09855 [Acidimicrobiales bacterium]
MKTLRALLLGLVLVATLTACGGGDDDDDSSDTTEESTTTTLSEEENKAAIESAVTEYFSVLGQGDVDAAVLLLEDGEDWRDEMVACSTITGGVSADVKTVELTDATNATATIDILGEDGGVLLPEAGAGAIKVDGEWLVSAGTFESLYDLAKDSCTGGATTTTAAN